MRNTTVDPLPWRNPHITGRIPELDGIRGLAILLVLIRHYVVDILGVTPGSWASYAMAVFRLSWSGVDLFFILSGFLIGGILLDAETRIATIKRFTSVAFIESFRSILYGWRCFWLDCILHRAGEPATFNQSSITSYRFGHWHSSARTSLWQRNRLSDRPGSVLPGLWQLRNSFTSCFPSWCGTLRPAECFGGHSGGDMRSSIPNHPFRVREHIFRTLYITSMPRGRSRPWCRGCLSC